MSAKNPPLIPVTEYAIVEAMDALGGSFVRALAELIRRADEENLAKIKAAWPEYWVEYAELAALRRDRGQGPN